MRDELLKERADRLRSCLLSHDSDLKDEASRGKFCLCAAFAIEILLISDPKLLQPTSLRAGQCIQVLSGKKFSPRDLAPVWPASTSLTATYDLDRSDIETSAASDGGSSVP
jgi:hypothetical protein